MRCVELGVQSGWYLAPISKAFSLSSPLKGFWNPLRTNMTPSMSWLNGTFSTPLDLAFCCLGDFSGFGMLSLFFSVDFCAGDAERKRMTGWAYMLFVTLQFWFCYMWKMPSNLTVNFKALIVFSPLVVLTNCSITPKQGNQSLTFFGRGAWRAGCTWLVFWCCRFFLRWASWAHFLWGRRPRARLLLFVEFKFSFSWWL